MATGSGLLDRVGYKILGKVLTSSTNPNLTDALQWLNDGQLELIRELSAFLTPELVTTYSPTTAAAGTKTTIKSDFLKNIRAYNSDAGEPCKWINYVDYVEILSGAHSYLTTSSYVYTIGNDSTNTVWYYFPSTDPTNMNFLYVREPLALTDNGNTFSLADEFEALVVDFAVAQHSLQEEEFETFDKMTKLWYEKIERKNKKIRA